MLVPKSSVKAILALLLVGVPLCVFGFAFIEFVSPILNLAGSAKWVWSGLIVALLVFGCVLTWIGHRMGPRLVYDRVKQTITLPAWERSWPMAMVLGWQIIHNTKTDEPSSEKLQLNLVVNEEDGSIGRHPLFSGVGRQLLPRIQELCADLEQKTSIGVVSAIEDGRERVGIESSHAFRGSSAGNEGAH